MPTDFPAPIIPPTRLLDGASLEQLRKQAKDVRDLAGAGIAGALALVGAHHPKGAHPVTLSGAQLVVARHYGYPSWARLKRHLELVEQYGRFPDDVPDDQPDPADRFLAVACLRYGADDDPGRWRRAAALLAEDPSLARSSIYTASACADVDE